MRRSPDFAPRDLLHETKASARAASAAHAPSLGYTPADEEALTPARSAWPVALLVILALAARRRWRLVPARPDGAR